MADSPLGAIRGRHQGGRPATGGRRAPRRPAPQPVTGNTGGGHGLRNVLIVLGLIAIVVMAVIFGRGMIMNSGSSSSGSGSGSGSDPAASAPVVLEAVEGAPIRGHWLKFPETRGARPNDRDEGFQGRIVRNDITTFEFVIEWRAGGVLNRATYRFEKEKPFGTWSDESFNGRWGYAEATAVTFVVWVQEEQTGREGDFRGYENYSMVFWVTGLPAT